MSSLVICFVVKVLRDAINHKPNEIVHNFSFIFNLIFPTWILNLIIIIILLVSCYLWLTFFGVHFDLRRDRGELGGAEVVVHLKFNWRNIIWLDWTIEFVWEFIAKYAIESRFHFIRINVIKKMTVFSLYASCVMQDAGDRKAKIVNRKFVFESLFTIYFQCIIHLQTWNAPQFHEKQKIILTRIQQPAFGTYSIRCTC